MPILPGRQSRSTSRGRLAEWDRAHIDGNYRVIAPLVAKDAGIGEIGRMGLLMPLSLGPRVRLGVVTTDLPLIADSPTDDPLIIDDGLRWAIRRSGAARRAAWWMDYLFYGWRFL